MSVAPGSSEPRAPGAVPFPGDKEHTHLGAYLRSLKDQLQAMTLEIEALRELLQEAGLISSTSFSARV
ncbi:MAG: hypothetical protein WCP63_05150 [Cyanobium sp. ELA712]